MQVSKMKLPEDSAATPGTDVEVVRFPISLSVVVMVFRL